MLKTVCGNFPSIETAFKLIISLKSNFFPPLYITPIL
ncbi:hypothetical protein J2Z29_001235 [Treponema pedis]